MARELVKLEVPVVAGITWMIAIHSNDKVDYEFVVPEKRRRQQKNALGVNVGENDFLSFRDGDAHGSYLLVNFIDFCIIGNKMLHTLENRWPTKIQPSRDAFHKFLSLRYVSSARTLKMLLGEPEECPNGWVRYAWRAYDEKSLDKITKMGMWKGSNSDNQEAWHGTKFECLYKTMVDGNLCEVDEPGRRIKDGIPGIYMMSTKRREKAEWYSRYVCLNDDEIWVRLVWELVTDRHDSVKSGNDQWIGRARSTKLVALRAQTIPTSELESSAEVQLAWDAGLEFQPIHAPMLQKGAGKGKAPVPPSPPTGVTVDHDMGLSGTGS